MSSERGVTDTAGYLDFEVEVGVGAAREYPVAVRSPAGAARETMCFPFDELALANRLLTLQNVLLRGVGSRRHVSAAASPEEQTVEDFGRALFEALLPGEARARYDVSRQMAREQGKGLRLRLHVLDAGLSALPWEFVYDTRRGDYVCLSQRTPLVRHLEVAQPVETIAVDPPLRILGMVASPSDLPKLDADRERERMERALADLRGRRRVEVVWLKGQTWDALLEAMWAGPWHVFHFVGHGGFEPRTGEGYLALVDDAGGGTHRLGATALGRLLDDHYPLRLAVLNACEGARADAQHVFSGAAATLVRMGLPAVVAMQYAITDQAAIRFAQAFYRALARARPVDGAVGAARQAMSQAAPESLEWATPVLYLRAPDAVLFGLADDDTDAPAEHEQRLEREADAPAGQGRRPERDAGRESAESVTTPAAASPAPAAAPATAVPAGGGDTVTPAGLAPLLLLLLAAGWALIWGATVLVPFFPWATAGAVGGLFVGFVLRRIRPAVRLWHVLVLAVGWALAWTVAHQLIESQPLGAASSGLVGRIAGWALGGLVTGLVLHLADPAIRRPQVLAIAAGWAAGALSVHLLYPTGYELVEGWGYPPGAGWAWAALAAATGAVEGAIGGAVMLGQLRTPGPAPALRPNQTSLPT